MDEVEVPSYFLCPISLQIMRDPVTLSTGITYDRSEIERWIFTGKNLTCPITRQPLPSNSDLIPNHTLRRLIQSWCTANASYGIERFPTPKPPVDQAQISKLLDEANFSVLPSLKKLKNIISDSERNRRCVESSSRAIAFLALVVGGNDQEREGEEESLNILYSLQISEQGLHQLLEDQNVDFVNKLTNILQRSNCQSRAYATLLLKSLLAVISPVEWKDIDLLLFKGLVRVLRDRISYQATKAALQILGGICSWGKNKVSAVEAGAVPVLIELLLDEPEKRACEMMLVVLDRLCECAEGRADLIGHAAGVAVVAKKLVRVSLVASERAVRILYSGSRVGGGVLKEMVEVGAVSKLCLLIQVDCGRKTKEMAKEMLRLNSRVWRNSPCISPQLQASYPSPLDLHARTNR